MTASPSSCPSRPSRRRGVVAAAVAMLAMSVLAAGCASPREGGSPGPTAATVDVGPASPTRPAVAAAGHVRRLEILPLVDWAVARPGLVGEAGVSYLIRTDGGTVLMDLGGNLAGQDPSPLLANMRRLGVSLDTVDTVVVTHAHLDHVGGQRFAQAGTFSTGRTQGDLAGKRLVVPVPLTYPGASPVVAHDPMVLSAGVVTTGALPGRLYIGAVDEQAIAIRVAGHGVVLIVGCGHQGLAPVLERTRALFGEPIASVVGGLHYPVPAGRWTMGGIDVQRWAAWGPDSAAAPTLADVQRDIDRLVAAGVRSVSLSPHDSSDEVIDLFRRAFGAGYRDLRVGEPLLFGDAR